MIEKWRDCWRRGVVPNLTTGNLLALRKALDADDPRLIQGATTLPPPLQCLQDWNVEAACAFSLPGACDMGGFRDEFGDDAATVAETEEFFAQLCFKVDQTMGECAGCRWFLNWFDDTPRQEMRALLSEEINLALEGREKTDGGSDVSVRPADGDLQRAV
jgi:hypothetical protein